MLDIYELNEDDIVLIDTEKNSVWLENIDGTYSKTCQVTLIDGFIVEGIYKTVTKERYFLDLLKGK